MIIETESLVLVDVNEINFQGKNGEAVHKFKYTFVNKDGGLSEYYADTNELEKDLKVVELNKLVDSDFKVYSFKVSVYNGIKKRKLLIEQN